MSLSNQTENRAPIWLKVARVATCLYALAGLVLIACASQYSSVTPSAEQSFELRLQRQHVFVNPWLGYSVVTFFPIMGILTLVLARADRRFNRRTSPKS